MPFDRAVVLILIRQERCLDPTLLSTTLDMDVLKVSEGGLLTLESQGTSS